MCGIVGAFTRDQGRLLHSISLMERALVHRGPDDSGLWSDTCFGIALAHRRLAVLDLSPTGHQPMVSQSGRYVIAFNGEVYNHLRLRKLLPSFRWKGHSDTETLLAAIEAWGLEEALRVSVGMFALALWDRDEKILHLARDRFGEKPLYVGLIGVGSGRSLVFGSELSALRAWPDFSNAICLTALAQYLRFGALASPSSIYDGISQLSPGHIMTICLESGVPEVLPISKSWWSFLETISFSMLTPFTSRLDALEVLESALTDAVQLQSQADVPLGSFLSGGIDSSLITALLQTGSGVPVKTFTVGFDDPAFNESTFARDVAAYLGTEHTSVVLTASDALSLIDYLPRLYSEPFADFSQLPTHLVCREARRSGLTVALSGDGGDELFGGYGRYFWGVSNWSRWKRIPTPIRHLIGRILIALPCNICDLFGRPLKIPHFGQKVHELADRLVSICCDDDLYASLVSHWLDPASLLQGHNSASILSWQKDPVLEQIFSSLPSILTSPVQRMMACDTLNYLPNDILVKVDRAAMAVSLETRAPFLDHRVAQVAWSLPMAMRTGMDPIGRDSKSALRQILYKYVPQRLIDRPKAGFGVPVGQWLRGPLRPWAEDLLSPSLIHRQGYLHPEPIQKLWRQHLSGRFDHTNRLWTVLMWQAWLAEWE